MIHRTLMTDDLDSLILDLLERLGSSPRPYSEVLDAWQTSCPRLPVWEDANDRGFVECQHDPGRGRAVSVSTAGAEYLRNNRVRARASKAPSVGDGDPRPRSPATSQNSPRTSRRTYS
jgi:hypothetical protein